MYFDSVSLLFRNSVVPIKWRFDSSVKMFGFKLCSSYMHAGILFSYCVCINSYSIYFSLFMVGAMTVGAFACCEGRKNG